MTSMASIRRRMRQMEEVLERMMNELERMKKDFDKEMSVINKTKE